MIEALRSRAHSARGIALLACILPALSVVANEETASPEVTRDAMSIGGWELTTTPTLHLFCGRPVADARTPREFSVSFSTDVTGTICPSRGALEKVLSIVDEERGSVYELFSFVREKDGKHHWIGRRLKACEGGVWIDLAISGKAPDVGFTAAVRHQKSRVDGSFLIDGKEYDYPALAEDKPGRKSGSFSSTGTTCFVSAPDSTNAFRLWAPGGKRSSVRIYVWSIKEGHGSVQVRISSYRECAAATFFLSLPGLPGDNPDLAGTDNGVPLWIRDAEIEIMRTVEGRRLVVDRMVKEVKPADTLDGVESLKHYRAVHDGLHSDARAAEEGGVVTFDEWARIVVDFGKVEEARKRVLDELPFLILFGAAP